MGQDAGDWASLLMHDWASLLIQTLQDSPLLLRNTCHMGNWRFNGWQCHILSCLFSSLAPRICSEMMDWNWICRNLEASESLAVQTTMKDAFHAIKQAEIFMEFCASDQRSLKALASAVCTGEDLNVHIHDLFWSISSLHLATRVALGLPEDQLNAVMERQVQCWSTTIAQYRLLGAELLDLRQMFHRMADEERNSADSELGTESGNIAAMIKLLTRRLQWGFSREQSEITSSLDDLKIDTDCLQMEKTATIGSKGHFAGSWSGLSVVIKECRQECFRDQAPTLLRMRNPFILQLIGWAADLQISAHVCYMVMEVAETDLRSFMMALSGSKGWEPPFAFHIALDIMLQIARGMCYLHKNGTAHGSLDASCVLLKLSTVPELSGEGYARVKLCEIGQAKLFFPEESILEKLAADVYSFGQLCMEILSGKQHHAAADIDLPPGIPALLSNCVHACCDTDYKNRPEFGVICGLFRHLKLIVTSPHRLERVLNFFPEEDTAQATKFCNGRSTGAATTDTDFWLQLININVNALHLSTPPEIYPLVAAEADGKKAVSALGLRILERMSGELLSRCELEQNLDRGPPKFVVSIAGSLKAFLVEGFSGLLKSWCTTTLGMATLETWLPHLPADWKSVHRIALGLALCLRFVAKTPPKFGFYSEEQGIDGFYPIEPQNILLNCQFKVALLLDNSAPAWKRLTQWVGVHPQVRSGENILVSIEAYTTYYFGHLLCSIINATTNFNLPARPKPLQSSSDQHLEFVLSNLAMRCSDLKCLSMTEVVTLLVNEYRP